MGFLTEGKKKEKQFAQLLKDVVFSNKEQDIKEHWDLKVEMKFDVKSLKKLSREDSQANEFYHFVEFKNVNGEKGWLYGDADYFAFETNAYWVIVSKEELTKFVHENTVKKTVNKTEQALYCLYRREGRKDLITLIKTLDLMYIAAAIVPKKEGAILHTIGTSIK